MNTIISSYLRSEIAVPVNKSVIVSTVAYAHPLGIPARFCTGMLPVVSVARELLRFGTPVVVRIVDPTPIANYCNGWGDSNSGFREIVNSFFEASGLTCVFDQAEPVTPESLKILNELGSHLLSAQDSAVIELITKIQESGRKHGGESGSQNAILYMAAHPFSWLDIHHPLIWNGFPPSDSVAINLMSRSEERFSVVRRYLVSKTRESFQSTPTLDVYTQCCDTPCYIPLAGEPMFDDLNRLGYEWCLERYKNLKKQSRNHERALSDFKLLMNHLGKEV